MDAREREARIEAEAGMGENAKISNRENIHTEIKDGTLIIRINLNEGEVELQPSSSGKTLVIATTGGARAVGMGGKKLNLTLYRKP